MTRQRDELETDVNDNLSARQREIIDYASRGFTDAAMAEKLGISEGTIGTHWSRIRAKIGPYSRSELVAIGVRGEYLARVQALTEERETLREQLGTAEAELAAGITGGDGVVGLSVFDHKHRIVFANEASCKLLGYSAGALVGRHLKDICAPRLYRSVRAQHEELHRRPGFQSEREVIAAGLNTRGEEIMLRVVRSSLQWGERTYVVGLFRALDEA